MSATMKMRIAARMLGFEMNQYPIRGRAASEDLNLKTLNDFAVVALSPLFGRSFESWAHAVGTDDDVLNAKRADGFGGVFAADVEDAARAERAPEGCFGVV